MDESTYNRRLFRTLLAVALAFGACWVLYLAREALLVLYVSGLLAMGLSPLVRLIEGLPFLRRRARTARTVAILVIYLALVVAAVLIALAVLPPLVEQSVELWTRLPSLAADGQKFLIRRHLIAHPITLQEAVSQGPGTGGSAAAALAGALFSVIGGVFGLVSILILTFYLLVDADLLVERWAGLFSGARREAILKTAGEVGRKVSAWLSAQLILSGVMGTATAVGLGVIGVPYFYVIGLIAAVGETIPMVGPVVAGIVAVLVASTVSSKLALLVLAYFTLLHLIEANVLLPKIMERRVGVSPAVVMAALLVGASLHGLMGAVLAVPTAAIVVVILDELLFARAVE